MTKIYSYTGDDVEKYADMMITKMRSALEKLPECYFGRYESWAVDHFVDLPWDNILLGRVTRQMWKDPEFTKLNDKLFERCRQENSQWRGFFHPRNVRELQQMREKFIS